MDQGSNKNHSPAYNFTPTVTKFCVMWEGLSLPHDTKFGNCRCEIVDIRAFPSWSLIHGLRWSGLIKAEPGGYQLIDHMDPLSTSTVETLYNTVNFCWSAHKRHSIARPKGRGMGCLLWVQRATYCVDLAKWPISKPGIFKCIFFFSLSVLFFAIFI